MFYQSSSRRHAFTLIELLIVVAIIALLAAIMFPVFGRVRENARRSSCMSNMKQIGLGLMQYTQDYDETMPIQTSSTIFNFMDSTSYAAGGSAGNPAGTSTNWLFVLVPYTQTSRIFTCPSSMDNPGGATFAPTATSSASYAGNAVVIPNMKQDITDVPGAKARRLASISNSAGIIAAQELYFRSNYALVYPRQNAASLGYANWHNYGSPSAGLEGMSSLHFDGGNLIFCDGHAKWRKYQSLSSGEFGLTPNQKWSPTNQTTPDGGTTFTAAF